MMPIIERIQYPVGQGGFFAEHHGCPDSASQRTVVYDCGAVPSRRRSTTLEDQITEFLNRSARVDALVISHFHVDHINGLKTLMAGVQRGARRIFLPYLTPDERVLVTIDALIPPVGPMKPKNQMRRDLNLVVSWTRPTDGTIDKAEWTVVEVQSAETRFENGEELRIYVGDAQNGVNGYIDDNTTVSLIGNGRPHLSDWVLKFYNKKVNEESVRRCITALKAIGNFNTTWIDTDPDALIQWLHRRGHRRRIVEAYAAISKRTAYHNLVSLCCYSGPREASPSSNRGHSSIIVQCPSTGKFDQSESSRIGWLGTGDLAVRDPKTLAEFKEHYASISRQVGVIQIPHHGSAYNSDDQLYFNSPMIATVAYGTANNHHHPDGQVVINAQRRGVLVWPVTEYSSTTFRQCIFRG